MSTPQLSQPPAGTPIAEWVLENPHHLRQLRTGLFLALTGGDLTARDHLADIPEKMAVVATELATNALKYGSPPTIVRLCRADSHFILDIADHDPQILPEHAGTRPPGAGGLGLRLAQELALTIGWYITDTTKHVWAQFPATGPNATGNLHSA